MPTVYKFSISMPVTDVAPRNRISNTVHLEHTIGGLLDADLQPMCNDLVAMYQARYGVSNREVMCKAYDTDATPNYPRAVTVVNAGAVWTNAHPREVALCLSFAGNNRGDKSGRGRIYLMPQVAAGVSAEVEKERPSAAAMTWAMAFYITPNASFPDIGGVDWKFGIYSPTYKKFTQSHQAWCNDEWDTQRRRGLRETTRQSVNRDG